jgi:sirohydrochlorin ferrochelatase
VHTDLPAIVAGRPQVHVARHLGPDPTLVRAVAERLSEAGGDSPDGSVLMAAIASSRSSARAEVDLASGLLAAELGREVVVLALGGEPEFPSGPFAVAAYLLAEGGFLATLRENVGRRGVVAAPIGVHPALVSLVWARYDEVNLSTS